MADSVSFLIDTSKLTAALQKLQKKTGPAKQYSALSIGYEILRLSQMEVPHDKGTLQNSGTVQEFDDNVVVGYHTPYAARLHEHPEYNFQKGRKGKYLEDPIMRNLKNLGIKFVETMRENLHGALS